MVRRRSSSSNSGGGGGGRGASLLCLLLVPVIIWFFEYNNNDHHEQQQQHTLSLLSSMRISFPFQELKLVRITRTTTTTTASSTVSNDENHLHDPVIGDDGVLGVLLLREENIVPRYRDNDNNPNKNNNPKQQQRQLQEQNPESDELLDDDFVDTNEESNQQEVDIVVVTFEEIARTAVFLTAAWLLGRLAHFCSAPVLVGEIVCGFLLGPPLADFAPFPQALVLIGNFGLLGLILESGMDIDVAQLKESGPRAVIVALTGTTLPLLTGLGLGRVTAKAFRSAVAVGACFAPSSLGVSSNVLQAGNVLNTPIGQMIVASSVVDDVFGLILLSILQVLVQDDATAFDFVKPFLASFGFLLLLGWSGVTWIPWFLEEHVFPLFPDQYKHGGAVFIMFILLLTYMPLLNYTGASFLTGTFLAGLSFSQIHWVHASYAQSTRDLLSWLMRIFFAATIGFQVPVRFFGDPYVLKWGAKLLAAVFAKIPLGFLVPRNHQELPKDFPYDPYWRDVIIVSLAMMCRGEFNYIVASFSLAQGLLEPDLYAAVVLANLFATITGPLLLAKAIRYFNGLSESYMSAAHPVEQIGKTSDGARPLFVAIQARTPVYWGLQDAFRKTLDEEGLVIIDHRYWHTLGLDAQEITEIFATDTKTRITVRGCFVTSERENGKSSTRSLVNPPTALQPLVASTTSSNPSTRKSDTENVTAMALSSSDATTNEPEDPAAAATTTVPAVDDAKSGGTGYSDDPGSSSDAASSSSLDPALEAQVAERSEDPEYEEKIIRERCEKIREMLIACMPAGHEEDFAIKVSQWQAFTFEEQETGADGKASRVYRLLRPEHEPTIGDLDGYEEEDEMSDALLFEDPNEDAEDDDDEDDNQDGSNRYGQDGPRVSSPPPPPPNEEELSPSKAAGKGHRRNMSGSLAKTLAAVARPPPISSHRRTSSHGPGEMMASLTRARTSSHGGGGGGGVGATPSSSTTTGPSYRRSISQGAAATSPSAAHRRSVSFGGARASSFRRSESGSTPAHHRRGSSFLADEGNIPLDDLWKDDEMCHIMAREGYYMTPTEAGVFDVSGSREPLRVDHPPSNNNLDSSQNSRSHNSRSHNTRSRSSRRHHSFDVRNLHHLIYDEEQETHTIQERLHGYVR